VRVLSLEPNRLDPAPLLQELLQPPLPESQGSYGLLQRNGSLGTLDQRIRDTALAQLSARSLGSCRSACISCLALKVSISLISPKFVGSPNWLNLAVRFVLPRPRWDKQSADPSGPASLPWRP
jgi:hypothetical protein